jgi:hypothetical protein
MKKTKTNQHHLGYEFSCVFHYVCNLSACQAEDVTHWLLIFRLYCSATLEEVVVAERGLNLEHSYGFLILFVTYDALITFTLCM